jgi:hypothetical protein
LPDLLLVALGLLAQLLDAGDVLRAEAGNGRHQLARLFRPVAQHGADERGAGVVVMLEELFGQELGGGLSSAWMFW